MPQINPSPSPSLSYTRRIFGWALLVANSIQNSILHNIRSHQKDILDLTGDQLIEIIRGDYPPDALFSTQLASNVALFTSFARLIVSLGENISPHTSQITLVMLAHSIYCTPQDRKIAEKCIENVQRSSNSMASSNLATSFNQKHNMNPPISYILEDQIAHRTTVDPTNTQTFIDIPKSCP